jgi:hypothetical protein
LEIDNSAPSESFFICKHQRWETRVDGMLLQQPLAEVHLLWVIIRAQALYLLEVI